MMTIRTVLRRLAALAAMALAAPLAAQPAAAPSIVGDWHGTIVTPQGDIVLVLTVTREADGSLKAQVENANQAPGRKADVSRIAASEGHLSWQIERIGASFEGDWSVTDRQWRGTFTQGQSMPMAFTRGLPPPLPVVAGLDGQWSGTIALNGATLRQVLRIQTGPRGTVMLYDSPDQMANGLPVEGFVRDGQAVRFSILRDQFRIAGTLSDDLTRFTGTIVAVARDTTTPLELVRAAANAEARPPARPQMPVAPFPYTVEEVAFDNPTFAEVHLAGSLTLPAGKGPFPAVVLITGSGGQDRDETLMGHKPFAVIADYLTRRGIAVLRFDDRGIGKSKGRYELATSADLATDANAAFAYLRTRKEIRGKAIGFVGHSEGGMIGPIAMASNPDVAFLVMLAGPGTRLDTLMLSQRRLALSQMGMSEADLDRAEPVMASLFRAIAAAPTPEAGQAAALALLTPEAKTALGVPPTTDGNLIVGQLSGPWFSYFIKYDPLPNLTRIKAPVLALNGSLDRQVPAKDNLAAIRSALAGNRDATIEELPGLNHLFQTARTGAIGEYADIEETVAPVVLERVAGWIGARFDAAGGMRQ